MAKYFSYQEKEISVGDTVRVHQEITEGGKTRIQVFEGIVIAIKNRGVGQTFTVRKIASNGIGVEKIYPVRMPSIKKIEIKSKGDVRRAKLYYLRERIGKRASKVKEKIQTSNKVARTKTEAPDQKKETNTKTTKKAKE